jgi:predicted secreted protein
MSTDLTIGHGTAFKRSSDATSGGTMTAVAEVISISGPGLARDTVDVTDMDSTDRWREYIGGLKDGGEVTLEVGYVPNATDVTNWLADINTNTAGYYQVVWLTGSTTWGFSGIMTGFEPGTPLDDKMTASVTYKLTGKPTFIA